jgi:hypothetical protein
VFLFQIPFPEGSSVLEWAKAVFGPLEKGGLGVQLRALMVIGFLPFFECMLQARRTGCPMCLQDIPPWLAEEERTKGMQAALDEARDRLHPHPSVLALEEPKSPRDSRGSFRASTLASASSPVVPRGAQEDAAYPELSSSPSPPEPGSAAPHPAEQLRLHAYFKVGFVRYSAW